MTLSVIVEVWEKPTMVTKDMEMLHKADVDLLFKDITQ